MGELLKLPEPKDQWLFNVDVYRRPDGSFAARLADARTSLVESGDTDSSSKLSEIADMLEQSIASMRADAEMLKS